MQKRVRQRRLVRESEPEPSPGIRVGATVYGAGGRGPSGEVIAMTRGGRAVVRWHGMSRAVTTMHAPGELIVIENPDEEEAKDDCEA